MTTANIIELDGYTFILNRDQYYHDIIHLPNKSIGELKKVADSLENCVGFNTAGYLKSHITTNLANYANPPSSTADGRVTTQAGLYIKKSFPLKILTGPAGMEDSTGSVVINMETDELQTHTIKYFTLSTMADLTQTGETVVIDRETYIFLPNVDCTDFTYLYLPNQSVSNLNTFLINDPCCFGFTSDGFLKYFIASQYLVHKTYPVTNTRQGLYLHLERYKAYLNNKTSGSIPIPKIIHFHLYGEVEFSIIHVIAIKSALLYNPTYKICVHCEKIPFQNAFFESIRDLVDVQIWRDYLYTTGGIYLDFNLITLKSFDEFIENTDQTIMTYETENKNSVSKDIIMTIPQNPFIKEWMKFEPKKYLGDLPFKLSDKYHLKLVLPNFSIKVTSVDHPILQQFNNTNNNNKSDILTNYNFYSNKDSDMYDYMYVHNKSLEEAIRISDSDDKIRGFLYNGKNAVMKYDIIDEFKDFNYGISSGGMYVKKQWVPPQQPIKKIYNVKPICNWCSSDEFRESLNKMTPGYYNWNNLLMNTYVPNVDYYFIINQPYEKEHYDPAKTIVFQMEPMRDGKDGDYGVKAWGEWAHPSREKFLMVNDHKWFCNNLEWHLGKTYAQLIGSEGGIEKNPDAVVNISAVVSNKLLDEGHHKRLNFLKYVESKDAEMIDIWGRCQNLGFKNYKGELPSMNKDAGILPYKYHFVCENNREKNYITEKVIDGILGEALCFYWGCPNISDYIDPQAYITLELENFEADYNKVKECVANNEWEKR